MAIDRRSPIPFYFQLTELLRREIEVGRWAVGERLPSEPAICEQFGVSRTTVRQALGSLEAEGLIRRDKGRGTFVAERRSDAWLLQSAHGFHEEAERVGHSVRSRVLHRAVETLPPWASDALRLRPGSDGVTVTRLRWMDDRLDSPWYPSMRLFRRHPDEAWAGLVTRLREDVSRTFSAGC